MSPIEQLNEMKFINLQLINDIFVVSEIRDYLRNMYDLANKDDNYLAYSDGSHISNLKMNVIKYKTIQLDLQKKLINYYDKRYDQLKNMYLYDGL